MLISACNGQQPQQQQRSFVTSEAMEDVKPKPNQQQSADRFYDQNLYHPPQSAHFNCYAASQEGAGFLEGMFNASGAASNQDVTYDTHAAQYSFDPTSGHFLPPVNFLPQQQHDQSEPHQTTPMTQTLKANQPYLHEGHNHQQTPHIGTHLSHQQRITEDTASSKCVNNFHRIKLIILNIWLDITVL